MDRHSVDWRGYMPAVTTPFTRDGDFDPRGWQELLEWMVAEKMHGVVIAGTTGEWTSLSEAERRELFRLAAQQIRGRIPVIAGCSAYTPAEAVRYAQYAKELGLDGILLSVPPYVHPTRREIVAFYKAVSDAVPIPIVVYNWPRGTAVDMDRDLVLRLADIENVVAIKNSTPDVGNFVETLVAVKDQLRYFGFPYTEFGITLLQTIGGDGTMGAGAVMGYNHAKFYDCLWSGDLEGAREAALWDRAFFEATINPDYSARWGSPPALLKTCLNLRGLPGGYPRPPLLPLTDEETEEVAAMLQRLGLGSVR